jgi:hypothetical protein
MNAFPLSFLVDIKRSRILAAEAQIQEERGSAFTPMIDHTSSTGQCLPLRLDCVPGLSMMASDQAGKTFGFISDSPAIRRIAATPKPIDVQSGAEYERAH